MRLDIIDKVLVYLLFCVFFIFFSSGGVHIGTHPPDAVAKKPSPPPHAKAHGYRAKCVYRYYPLLGVYFDVNKKAYFYLEGGNWMVSLSLPQDIRIRLGDYVTLEMDTDKPYTHYEEHKRNYPPGQLKKKR